MDYRILIVSRKDLKIIIIGTVIGGIFQLICRKYLKNHPELLHNENVKKVKPVIETKKTKLRRFFPRGGALISITGAKIVVDISAAIVYIADKGMVTGTILALIGIGVKKVPIPMNAISTVLRNALPTTHSDLEKNFILVDGKKISLDKCDQTFTYMFQVLSSPDIPFQEKEEWSLKILRDHLDLDLGTTSGRVHLIFCIISILYIFAIFDISSYFLMIKNLIKAIKDGKISKQLARLIIRRLRKLNIPIDPELIDAVAA